MECLLEANPSPEVTWFQGNKVIADSSRVKMTRTPLGKDTFALALEILNPTKEDGGNYRCNACNAYGESNANIALNFQGNIFCRRLKNVFPKFYNIVFLCIPFINSKEARKRHLMDLLLLSLRSPRSSPIKLALLLL